MKIRGGDLDQLLGDSSLRSINRVEVSVDGVSFTEREDLEKFMGYLTGVHEVIVMARCHEAMVYSWTAPVYDPVVVDDNPVDYCKAVNALRAFASSLYHTLPTRKEYYMANSLYSNDSDDGATYYVLDVDNFSDKDKEIALLMEKFNKKADELSYNYCSE